MAEEKKKTALVVSAHSGDFVWRAGGAIALYASRGWKVKIVCLSFGERGESAKLWKEGGMTLERGRSCAARRRWRPQRSGRRAGVPRLRGLPDEFHAAIWISSLISTVLRPRFILTHSLEDPYNFDQPLAARVAQEARIVAQAHGHKPGGTVLGAPPSSCLSRIRPSSATGNPRCCSTSPRSGIRSGRLSRSWRRRNTSGSTTPGWR